MNIIYLNGAFIPQEEARISIMDRGFLFGDGVYEVMPVFEGLILCLEEHLARLNKSLDMIYMYPPLNNDEWKSICYELLKRNKKIVATQNIYLQVTRGPQETRDHTLPETYTPTILAFLSPSKKKPRDILAKGFSAITLDDSRRRDCCIKAITLLPNILLYEEARKLGAAEAILIRNGEATEATSSNLFIVIDNELITPPLKTYILNGVTRALIISLAKRHNIPISEKKITEAMLNTADEVWVTGSSKEIFPITKLNDRPVGGGTVGTLWCRMIDYYEAYKKELLQKNSHHPTES